MKSAADLQKENEELRAQLLDAHSQIDSLNDRLQSLLQKHFAPSSEKASPDQMGLFSEAESEEEAPTDEPRKDTEVKGHTRTSKPRVSIPANVPREEIVYDISDEEKVCPHDGSPLECIGSEDQEKLDIVPAQIKVFVHRRLKYACTCCNQHIVTAAKPAQPIEKSIASPGLLAFVATQKYADALPLYRQSEMFKRIGIEISRQNLANWMVKCGELVQPLINLLLEELVSRPIVHMDETTLQVLNEEGKLAQSKSYMWLMASFAANPISVFTYDASRTQAVPTNLLQESVEALMVDGYDGYNQACATHDIQRLGCWAHARRKFVEAQKLQPKGKTGKADQAIAFIQKLYKIEQRSKALTPEERYDLRQKQAPPILDKLKKWLEKSLQNTPPKMALGKALVYLQNQWPRLTRYLEDGRYPIDNNAAERAIRPFTIGRKNWLFSNSTAGAKSSANLYSLVQTAKANDINPYRYLHTVFTQLPQAQTAEDVEALLPWNISRTELV
ncbi:transposase [Alteromonadaceae bacterium Bs31]|nr:transposase [Alteromonadaceae bacterium Bs31]